MQLFGSGPILNEALRAQKILAEKYRSRPTSGASPATTNCAATRWRSSAGTACIPPKPQQQPYILEALEGREGPIIASTDYMKAVPDQIAPWLAGRLVSWAPTASAAARIASICAGISKSTPNRSPRRRCRAWRAKASSTPSAPSGVPGTRRRHREDRPRPRVVCFLLCHPERSVRSHFRSASFAERADAQSKDLLFAGAPCLALSRHGRVRVSDNRQLTTVPNPYIVELALYKVRGPTG